MDAIVHFIQSHRPFFDAVQAVSSVFNVLGWLIGAVIITIAWRRNAIRSVTFGPIAVQMQEAVTAAAAAARDWQERGEGGTPAPPVDVERIRTTIGQAFEPKTASRLTGKSVLWVDDNPANNELAMRALRRLQLDVEQVVSTEAGLAALQRRHFDLVISDMGRGDNMRAGYDLLQAIRDAGNAVPFLIFAGSDRPEYRREAAERGAQLSTNDMLELIDTIIRLLGK